MIKFFLVSQSQFSQRPVPKMVLSLACVLSILKLDDEPHTSTNIKIRRTGTKEMLVEKGSSTDDGRQKHTKINLKKL